MPSRPALREAPLSLALAVLGLCALSVGGAACAKSARRSTLMHTVPSVTSDERALRLALYEYTYYFSRRVEQAAGQIADSTADAQLARHSLDWRLNAVSEIQRASFQQDVLLALLDAWTFTLQQQQFFDSEAGRQALATALPIARQTSAELVERMNQLVVPWASDTMVKRGAKVVREWARDHPIEDLSFNRRSIITLYLERVRGARDQHDVPQSVANIEGSMEDLMQRMNLYAAQIPRQTLGESERLIDHLLEKQQFLAAFAALNDVRIDMRRMATVMTGIPATIGSEREAAFASIAEERVLLLEAISDERRAIEKMVERERALVMSETRQMMQSAFDKLTEERQIVIQGMPESATRMLVASQPRLEGLVDRFLWGFAGLLGGAGVALAALVVVARKRGWITGRP